jgi:hypothetical protein
MGYVSVLILTIIYTLWNTAKLCYTGFFLPPTGQIQLDSLLFHYIRYFLVMLQFLLVLSVTLFALLIAFVICKITWFGISYNNEED